MLTYFPILRTKAGETTALRELDQTSADRILPVFRLLPNVSPRFGPSVAGAWKGRSLALGGGVSFATLGTTKPFTDLFHELGKAGVGIIPSVAFGAPASYLAGLKPLVGVYAPGLVVRVDLNDLAGVGAWIALNGWAASDVHLAVWLGHIAAWKPTLVEPVVTAAISGIKPAFAKWRSVILASSSAPKDFGGLPLGRSEVARRDWELWKLIHGKIPNLHYADTGTIHPSLEEPPGIAAVNATVSVKYTVDDKWLVFKGASTRGAKGKPMNTQFKAHAISLTKEPLFDKLPACWADDEIRAIAKGAQGSGNRQTWVQLGLNRHLSLVVDRLP